MIARVIVASLFVCLAWAKPNFAKAPMLVAQAKASSAQTDVTPAPNAAESKSGSETTNPSNIETKPSQTASAAPTSDAASEYHTSLALSLSPALKRSSEVRYDHLTSSINKTTNHLDGFSLGLNLIYQNALLHGWRASAGLDFEGGRDVWFTDRLGQAHKFEASATGTYLAIGYQFWRMYADFGMQFPLYFQKEWETFNVETVPGGRINLGIEVTSYMQLELFYRFHSYALTEKVPVASDPTIRIFNSSGGIMLKFSDSRTK